MKKQRELTSKIPSWYPTATEIVDTQREQVLKSRQEAAAFASQKFGKPETPWWRRIFGKAT